MESIRLAKYAEELRLWWPEHSLLKVHRRTSYRCPKHMDDAPHHRRPQGFQGHYLQPRVHAQKSSAMAIHLIWRWILPVSIVGPWPSKKPCE